MKRYVSEFITELDTGERKFDLIWGDLCHVLQESGARTKVRARGQEGWVPSSHLSTQQLLEIYVIDVGQGDGILIKTPDGKWHLVDGGVRVEDQNTRKGAANFLRWKFVKDLRRKTVALENVIMSHPDSDHYGGLIDVLLGRLPAAGSTPERHFDVEVEHFYHGGMGRFSGKNPLGAKVKGRVDPFPLGAHGVGQNGSFITELLSGKGSFGNPARDFTDDFAELADAVGRVPAHVARLDSGTGHLPGYGPNENDCVIHVLGPVLERLDTGERGLRWLASESVTRNGHSVVLRLDYGQARILLTGDLNTKSQQLLMSYTPELDFCADVAKGCHHGSDDIYLPFVRAMGARATVISSGDNEDYAHPRPRVLGASARYGREGVGPDGEVIPPLLYSTELARSVKLAYADRVRWKDDAGKWADRSAAGAEARVDQSPSDYRDLGRTQLAVDLVYGLVNVRTDGNHILFATLEEKGSDFDCRVIQAGMSPGS